MMRTWQQLKNIYHFLAAHWWRLYFGRPDACLQVLGVTGTNGKTTTCYVLDGILAAAYGREQVGMLTTVAFRIGATEETNTSKMTTLPSRLIYQKLREACDHSLQYVVLEVTSHALDQYRLAGLRLVGGIILNVEREHLDYHGTMQAYAAAKARLVSYLRPGAPLVIKKDDQWIQRMRLQWDVLHSFTSEAAGAVATPLAGDINKENVLAAQLLARAIGVGEAAVTDGTAAVSQIPGRMEWVRPGVLIDYAVTPGALERLYRQVREQTRGRVFAVLGAAGQRDRGKRPEISQVVSRFADEIVLTREDPWTEDEEQIFADLERGLAHSEKPWKRILDRREAIGSVLRKMRPGDTIVVTGKGAERGMAVGQKIIPWNDKDVIEALLEERANDS